MADDPLRQRIDALVEEEHGAPREACRAGARRCGARTAPAPRGRSDQTWDLLRRRNARREAGQDPSSEPQRDATTVEGYLQ